MVVLAAVLACSEDISTVAGLLQAAALTAGEPVVRLLLLARCVEVLARVELACELPLAPHIDVLTAFLLDCISLNDNLPEDLNLSVKRTPHLEPDRFGEPHLKSVQPPSRGSRSRPGLNRPELRLRQFFIHKLGRFCWLLVP